MIWRGLRDFLIIRCLVRGEDGWVEKKGDNDRMERNGGIEVC